MRCRYGGLTAFFVYLLRKHTKNDIIPLMNIHGVIFISGAGLSSWIWDEVASKIHAPSIVADYLAVRQNKNASLEDYVSAAAKSAEQLKANKVIIVAHSIGGVVGIELARQLGDRAAGIIGVSAAMPIPGGNFFSCLPFPQKVIMPIIVKLAGTKPPESAIRNGLANDLQGDVVGKLVSSFQPEAKGLYYGKTSAANLPDILYGYIRTTSDKELPNTVQDTIIKHLPHTTTHDIASGHLPMLSHAAEVAAIVDDFIESTK